MQSVTITLQGFWTLLQGGEVEIGDLYSDTG